jgi:hypothetical protein
MFSPLEIIGVIAAVVAAVVLGLVLQKYIGGVEDTMNEMRESERDSTPATTAKPVRHVDTRRKRR